MSAVLSHGSPVTSPGEPVSPTTRSKAAYDLGVKHGAARLMNSPVMETIALELAMTRAALRAVSDEARRQQGLLDAWRDEAEFWKNEHAQTSREFSAFVELVGSKV